MSCCVCDDAEGNPCPVCRSMLIAGLLVGGVTLLAMGVVLGMAAS